MDLGDICGGPARARRRPGVWRGHYDIQTDLLRTPLRLSLIVGNDRAYNGLKGKAIYLSEEVTARPGQDIDKRLDRLMAGAWDITRITYEDCVLSIKHQGRIVPVIITPREVIKLSRALGIAAHDLTVFPLEMHEGSLRVGKKKKAATALTAVETKAANGSYFLGKKKTCPPPLLLVTEGREIEFGQADGQTFSWPGFTTPETRVVVFQFIDKNTAEIQVVNLLRGAKEVRTVNVGSLRKPTKKPTTPVAPTPASQSPRLVSSAIQAWLFDGQPRQPMVDVVERIIQNDRIIKLVSKLGEPYVLKGLGHLLKAGIRDVRVALQDETVDGRPVKTARLFKPEHNPLTQPEKCLIGFILPEDTYQGLEFFRAETIPE